MLEVVNAITNTDEEMRLVVENIIVVISVPKSDCCFPADR